VLLAALFVPAAGIAETGRAGVSVAPLGETIGVNTHYGAGREPVNAGALRRLAEAGVAFVRNDLDWASVERAAGVYDFAGTGVDALVAAAEQNGLRILFILDYGNPLYGPMQAVLSDEGRDAFAAYAAAAARRYGGRGHLWEIWNEPNLPQFWNGGGAGPDAEQYARLVDAVVPALHAADPSATILAGAAFMGLPDLVPLIGGIEGVDFLRRLFAAGVLDRADGISAHFYRAEPPESVAATVGRIRDAMQRARPPSLERRVGLQHLRPCGAAHRHQLPPRRERGAPGILRRAHAPHQLRPRARGQRLVQGPRRPGTEPG
jgi:hypothetical protein